MGNNHIHSYIKPAAFRFSSKIHIYFTYNFHLHQHVHKNLQKNNLFNHFYFKHEALVTFPVSTFILSTASITLGK
jgi:hypothetical protein